MLRSPAGARNMARVVFPALPRIQPHHLPGGFSVSRTRSNVDTFVSELFMDVPASLAKPWAPKRQGLCFVLFLTYHPELSPAHSRDLPVELSLLASCSKLNGSLAQEGGREKGCSIGGQTTEKPDRFQPLEHRVAFYHSPIPHDPV